jgi:hypothetical protein
MGYIFSSLESYEVKIHDIHSRITASCDVDEKLRRKGLYTEEEKYGLQNFFPLARYVFIA